MSQAVITKSFSEWKAQQAVNNKAVVLDEFVFAYIPDLDVNKPISNTETIPAADKIVHRQAVSKCGVVNDNTVVYSVTLGADVGDFNFNWIGLTNKATGILAMIIHAPAQSKVKNTSGQQGNVLVRSMLMEYSGAQAATEITTPAETWQIDFTARMAGMDERQRQENVDIYGAGAFFDDGYLVAKNGTQYFVTKGAGYVAGLRSTLAANQNITVTTKPVKVWLDVSWTGTLTSAWDVQQKITVAAAHADYVLNGIQHYVFALASIDANGNIADLRPKGTLGEQQGNSDFLRKDANLSELTDADKACDNLKLGTAAKASLTTSVRDSLVGRVLKVGDYGLGSVTGKVTAGIDFKSFVFIQGEHLFVNMATCTNIPAGLSTTTHYFITVHGMRDNDASPGLTLVNYNNPGEVWCAYGAGAAGNRSWLLYRQYNTGYKPSPSDIGAVPVGRTINGHALTSDANVTSPDIFNTQAIELGKAVNLNDYKTPGIYFQAMTAYAQAGSNYPEQLAGTLVVYRNASPGATQVYYVYNTSRVYVRGQYNSGAWGAWGRQYDTQNKPTAAEVGALSTGGGTLTGALTGAYTESYSFADQYNTKAPFYHAFTTSGVSEYHPLTKIRAWTSTNAWVFTQGVLVSGTALSYYLYCRGSGGQDISYKWDTSGNFTAPGMISPGNWTNFDGRYYTKAQSDAGYMPKTSAYTKGESDARYVQDTRLGSQGTITSTVGGNTTSPAGCSMTGYFTDGSANVNKMFYRPHQKYKNGVWATITQL